MASINKIHSTTMSLNDRFTAIATKPKPAHQSRPRSRSAAARGLSNKDPFTSVANRRLLQQLVRKDNLRAALKLKRRSMRTAGNGRYTRANLRANNGLALRRGTVKAIRVAANGRPIKTNSLSKVATMKADLVSAVRNRRPLPRSDSALNINNARLGTRRPIVGGAAQRVAQRRLSRGRGGGGGGRGRSTDRGRPMEQGGRSRSRSRGRNMPDPNFSNVGRRGRSQSRNRSANSVNTRNTPTNSRGRSRSRSRSRSRFTANNRNLPVKSRLGLRPGTTAQTAGNQRGGFYRKPNINNRGVAQGRVQKRNNNYQARTQGQAIGNNGGGRVGRTRGRSAVRGGQRGRSQSRNRRVSGGRQQQQQQQQQVQVGRRGRSQQRGRSAQRNGNSNANGNQQQQQRRGRSRSRGRGGRGGGGRNIGQNSKQPVVDRDALDKELDQYMATTKTENNVDYLLKN